MIRYNSYFAKNKENVYIISMSTTIKEIAAKANVSIATVSRALNNSKSIKRDTKKLILQTAKDLNYVPNIMARNLVKRKTNVIAFLLPEVGGEFFSEIIKGVDEVTYNNKYQLIVASSHSERNTVESTLEFLENSLVDGIVLMLPSLSEEVKDILKSYRTPIVIINGESNISEVNSVGIDNYQGTYSMTKYLIESLGYSKIAFIKGPSYNNDACERYNGFNKAIKDFKIKPNKEWEIDGDFSIISGEIACSRLLSVKKRPEVIFAANDMMAAGCYKAINSFGLKIPDDIGVVGFDHIFLADFLSPKLTTVHVPITDLGKVSAQLLFKQINSDNGKNFEHQKISTGIIIGESTKYHKKININK